MPFDGKEAQFETPALRRARLVEALRDPGADVAWFFPSFRTCACALAVRIGLIDRLNDNAHFTIAAMADAVGISFGQAKEIFGGSQHYRVAGIFVTPAMVADALEKIG